MAEPLASSAPNQAASSSMRMPSIRAQDNYSNNSTRSNADPAYNVTEMDQTFTVSTAISVAIDPVALITTECITVTSAMRKHGRWAHTSVSAILGGSNVTSMQNFESSRPGTPKDGLASRKGQRTRPSMELASGGDNDTGLANRWGLRGKKGKSMQDNPLMAAFAVLRHDLIGCKGRFYVSLT
jgi:golgi-specific brefeldin A-resistance guanine nucleotide exchange factor 1